MDSPKPHTVWIKTEDDSNTSSNIEETCKPSISNGFQEDVITKRRRMHKNEILGTYNLARLVTELSTREQAVIFAEEHGLILKKKICGRHKKPMVIGYNDRCSVGYFTCYAKICKGNRITRAKNTFFSQCKLSLKHVYYLMYCYAHRWSHEQVIWEDILKEEEEHCLSAPTISEWYGACRDAVVLYQLDKQSYQGKIGGPGKVVQIDKHVFGKRKGKSVEGKLLLGLLEDESEDLRLEICPDNATSANILVLIQKHVQTGTNILTNTCQDCDYGNNGYIHMKEAEDGTCKNTQKMYSQWGVVRKYFAKNNYNHPENFAEMCVEYLWRRSVQSNRRDPFIELVKAIRYSYDPYTPNRNKGIK